MPSYDFTCDSGNAYKVNIPEVTVAGARERLRNLREFSAEQSRLEAHVQAIDKHYDKAAESDDDDLDAVLARIDDLSARSKAATEAAARHADTHVLLDFFCDSVEGYDDLSQLPSDDMMELYRRCRGVLMGTGEDRVGEGE